MHSTDQNPWLKIPSEDYERHMSDEKVGQLQALNGIFKDVLEKYEPTSLCVLGCTTGNGFEHINPGVTKKTAGIDINEKYLKTFADRYKQKIPGLELLCGDLNEINLPHESFDLIHAALIFEYVDVEKVVQKILRWLKRSGTLVVVLQIKNENMNAVSETPFHSLKYLNDLFNYVEPQNFEITAGKVGLTKQQSLEYDLNTGKKFYVGYFVKE